MKWQNTDKITESTMDTYNIKEHVMELVHVL